MNLSRAQLLADRIARCHDPHAVLTEALGELTPIQLARIRYDWDFWVRPNQMIPAGPWKSYGFCGGIAAGKTRMLAEFCTAEVIAGRARRIGLCAQNEDKTFDVMVNGESGLIACSPPWFKAKLESRRVIWPNGAEAFPYTPEVPGAMRGPEHDLVWMSEYVAWPKPTRMEAFDNLQRRARIGYGKIVWDTTPERQHPILRRLFARAARDPEKHIIVHGTMADNRDNLTDGYVEAQYAEYGGTLQGKQELLGIFIDDSDDAIFRQEWIDRTRRPMPESLTRRILSVDPAITTDERYSDATGIVEMGLGLDGQLYVLRNMSGTHRHEKWTGMVIDAYVSGKCDCIVIETNRGGDAWAALLRVAARDRGLTLVELGPDEKPGHASGVVYLRPRNNRGKKAARAQGAALLVERGRVSFVIGADLSALEERLCVFDGTERTPDDAVDAFTQACHELGGLSHDRPNAAVAVNDAKVGQHALEQRIAQGQPDRPSAMSSVLRGAMGRRGGGGGDRI